MTNFAKLLAFFWVLSIGCSAQKRPEAEISALLLGINPHAGEFRSQDVVIVVNHLRTSGKSNALAFLKRHLDDTKLNRTQMLEANNRVLFVCRLLFVNPQGWSEPAIGQPDPLTRVGAAAHFPLFPMAVVEQVPFLLTEGYGVLGSPESAIFCLKRCEGFSLIRTNLKTTGIPEAAHKLIESPEFKNLYADEASQMRMRERILEQARPSIAATEK